MWERSRPLTEDSPDPGFDQMGRGSFPQGCLTSGFCSLMHPGGSVPTALCDLDWECGEDFL